jgi:hypothetical protein
MIAEATKVCRDCGQELPLSQFYRCSKGGQGVASYCKPCANKRKTANRQARLQHYRAYHRDYKSRRRKSRPEKALFSETKHQASRRNLFFSLTPEWFSRRILANRCELTGLEFEYGRKSLRRPSPDRIDNSLGYTDDNTRLICWGLNALKSHHSEAEFIAFLQDVQAGLNEQARTN